MRALFRLSAGFLKTIVALLADDDVVKDAETENLRGFCQLAVYAEIIVAGAEVAAGVVVREYYGGGTILNHVSEDFARMTLQLPHALRWHSSIMMCEKKSGG